VSIFNILGQEVIRKTPLSSFSEELDFSRLPSGAYFLKVTIDAVTKTVNIIKE
jgi:hypothetical protein